MIYPAAVTPFLPNGEIDTASVLRLLAWFRAAGCDGVVVAGTNGEGPSLSAIEKRDLMRLAVSLSEGLKVILGISTTSLTEAVWLSVQARKAGAEAALVMPPSYWPESGQEGIAAWFEAVMSESETPTIVYNFPKRVGFALEAETIERLARHPHFYGVKDSSGVEGNLAAFGQAAKGHRLFCGDESLARQTHAAGWTGLISGAANVLASWLAPIWKELSADPTSGNAKYELVLPAIQALRASGQPFTNKEILRRLGVIENAAVRLPLQGSQDGRLENAASIAIPLLRGTA